MTRLVHNDYLEQASDSGWVGFTAYLAFIVGCLYVSAKAVGSPWNLARNVLEDKHLGMNIDEGETWVSLSLWLGLLGWSLQSLFDFGLYIPALAWPAFTFLGVLVSQTSRIASTTHPLAPNLSARHENPVPQRSKSQPARRS